MNQQKWHIVISKCSHQKWLLGFFFCFCCLNICWGCQFLAVQSTWEPKTSTIIVLNGIGNGDLSWLGIILHRWDVISLYLTRAFHRKHQSIRTLSPALSFFLYPAMWANYCRNTQDTKLFHHIFASLDVHADWTSPNKLMHKLLASETAGMNSSFLPFRDD